MWSVVRVSDTHTHTPQTKALNHWVLVQSMPLCSRVEWHTACRALIRICFASRAGIANRSDLNVVIAGPNKPLSVYFIWIEMWISCSFGQFKKKYDKQWKLLRDKAATWWRLVWSFKEALRVQALCYLETDSNIIRQQKHPIYVTITSEMRRAPREFCIVLRRCYVIPHQMALSSG